MSKMGDFIAFNAAIDLAQGTGTEDLLKCLYEQCKELLRNDQLHTENIAKQVYKPFTTDEITKKIAQLITPPEINDSGRCNFSNHRRPACSLSQQFGRLVFYRQLSYTRRQPRGEQSLYELYGRKEYAWLLDCKLFQNPMLLQVRV